jgi:hypothetical protein
MKMVTGIHHLQTPISSPGAPKKHFQEAKTIQLVKKLTCAKTLKEARAQCVGQIFEAHRVHNAPYERLCKKKAVHTCEQHIYGFCRPLTHFWNSSQLDLTLKSEMNPNGGLVKDLRVP